MAETTTNTEEPKYSKATLEQSAPSSFKPSLKRMQERAENLSRLNERGVINESSGASVVARDDGQINLSSSEYAQYKLNPNGIAIEESIESVTITNRKKIHTDEIIINNHKLNPDLYEMTNFKQVLHDQHTAVGNFCVLGTVLVKAWDHNLQRYVMIRRQVRMPMFSPVINVPEIPTALKINDPLKETTDIQATMINGYQVNDAITDAQSNIDKTTSTNNTTTTNNNKILDSVQQSVTGI